MTDDDIDFEEWCSLLCALLDRIEAADSLEEAKALCGTRHQIAESMGLEVVFMGVEGAATEQ